MKKQRRRWTKKPLICQICKGRLHNNDGYIKKYGFCSVSCGNDYYGYS